ncbi:MAG: hypothetical protein AB7U20_15155 [Planctomycetaceae bacterium]
MKLSSWLSGIANRHQYRRAPRTRRRHRDQYRSAEVCRLEQRQLLAGAGLSSGV